MKSILSGIGVVILIFVVVSWLSAPSDPASVSYNSNIFPTSGSAPDPTANHSVTPAAVVAATPTKVLKISAAALQAKFDDNELAADQWATGAQLDITGVISSINKSDLTGAAYLELTDVTSSADVTANLLKSQTESAIKLHAGQLVTVNCKSVSKPFDVVADDCVIAGKPTLEKHIHQLTTELDGQGNSGSGSN